MSTPTAPSENGVAPGAPVVTAPSANPTEVMHAAQFMARDAKKALAALPAPMQEDPDIVLAMTLLTSVQWALIDARRHFTHQLDQSVPPNDQPA